MSQREDLRTLLNALPRLARLDGRSVEDVCLALEIDRGRLLEVIQSASALAWGEHEAGEVLDIWLEDGRLCVHTGGLFEQVVRLVPLELMALRLGAAQLAAAGLARDLPGLEALLGRIEAGLGSTQDAPGRLDAAVRAEADPALDPSVLDVVLQAHGANRRLRLRYFSHRSQQLRLRVVEPWAPFQDGGVWYLQAYDVEFGAPRTFRLDRVAEVTVLDDPCAPDDGHRPMPSARPEGGESPLRARLSGALARLAREQDWPDLHRVEDGCVELRTHAEDPDALLRHLLPWAPEVQLLEPAHVVTAWDALKEEMRRRHGADAWPQA